MSAPILLRRDFGASQLRGLAKKTKDGPRAHRLLALAATYDGATRTEAAMIGGAGLQIIRTAGSVTVGHDQIHAYVRHGLPTRSRALTPERSCGPTRSDSTR